LRSSDLAKSIYVELKPYRINDRCIRRKSPPRHRNSGLAILPCNCYAISCFMELREFAERVFVRYKLEEKLLRPADITTSVPAQPFVTPAAPGRPAELQFKATGEARDSFPGTKNLEQESERGRLLHFFANHELLATELMALVLVAFSRCARRVPPKAFIKRSKTSRKHTQLYLQPHEAMRRPFGELPVSAISGARFPRWKTRWIYVSSLCPPVPFEQANLISPPLRTRFCDGRRRRHAKLLD